MGSCATSFSVVACQSVSSALTLTTLTPGVDYFIRIYVTSGTTGNPSNKRGFTLNLQSSPNDNCSGAISLTPAVSCSNTTGSLILSTDSTGLPTGCETGGVHYDVWYSFVAANTSSTVTLSGQGTNFTNPELQLYSGSCGALTSLQCGTTSLTGTGLTIGTTYYIRVSNIGSSPATNGGFSICVANPTPPPSNDNCTGAITLSNGSTNNAGTVWNATASSSIPVGCATGNPDDDVWYKFTPSQSVLNITLSSIGSNLSASGAMIQLFSGACDSLVSVGCGNTGMVATVSSGSVYYIRVYSSGTGSIGGSAAGSAFSITATATAPVLVSSGRLKEVFQQTTLSGSNVLADPWEVTYGPDSMLYITESKGYKVYRMNPNTGIKTTILDISQGSTFFTAPADQAFNAQFDISTNNPQGGLAGLALHPKFMDPVAPQNYIYLSYIRSYVSNTDPNGVFYVNSVARFTYNTSTGKLESPVALCDTIPGSSDHNSQRMIIAPVGGTYYLFYAAGDMGAGQFGNRMRPNKAQNTSSYEGKILRFNLISDGDAGLSAWIPNSNPYNAALGVQSAVWCIGIRNNQGLAYDSNLDILYGTSHGPYSDDELNIIESGKNYGHPYVIGKASDGNYNTITAGTAPNMSGGGGGSSCPTITNELDYATNVIGLATYRDPIFTAYANSVAVPSVISLWNTTTGTNGQWPSEGWSGLDLYNNTVIPGWKRSLVAASLKWGRLVRMKLINAGTATTTVDGTKDTASYFGGQNRFRDLAFAPNGKDIFVVMERSSTSSGPSNLNPVVPACPGCLQKYTFLGYSDNGGKSSIPTTIDVTDGTVNTCNTGTTVTIDNINSNLWVPITGPDGNIMAEIYANGNILGTVTSSFYKNSGSIRVKNGNHYLDRNITITPQYQPGSAVKIRLYISKAEFDALDADPLGAVSGIGDLKILKNSDACGSAASGATTLITPVYAEAHGANGYMLQGNITGFSSFYFSNTNFTLPLDLLTFSGALQANKTVLLKWKTENERNTSHFVVERSADGINFTAVGTVAANGNSLPGSSFNYSLTDQDVVNQASLLFYYRLRMVDLDGSIKFSNTITISLKDISPWIVVSPNPVATEVKVNVTAPAEGTAQWKLIDIMGKTVLQNSILLRKGSGNIFSVDMNKLSTGAYYLKVTGEGIDQQVKLQKL
jgi:PQQ-dependent dehydrogenase (s-GDH family)